MLIEVKNTFKWMVCEITYSYYHGDNLGKELMRCEIYMLWG